MKNSSPIVSLAACAMGFTMLCGAAEPRAKSDATSKWMIEQETAWAQEECGHKSILADLLADDFLGTSPKGQRYTKRQALAKATAAAAHATDCRLLHADVHFYGPETAIIYGSETALEAASGGKPERYCLIWTDTWLKRSGKWQIVAAQDTLYDCPAL
jgi:hypothetical protein